MRIVDSLGAVAAVNAVEEMHEFLLAESSGKKKPQYIGMFESDFKGENRNGC